MRSQELKVDQIRQAVTIVTRMLARREIKVTQMGANAYCNYDSVTGELRYINLPMVPDRPTELFLKALQGFLDHECAHALFTDALVWGEGNKRDIKGVPKEVINSVINIVEDVRIEAEMAKLYAGSGANLSSLATWLCEDIWGPMLDKLGPVDLTDVEKTRQMRSMLFVPYIRARAEQHVCQSFLADRGLANLFAEMDSRLPDLPADIAALTDTATTVDLAEKIVRALDFPPPPPPQKNEGSGGKDKKPQQKDDTSEEKDPDESKPGKEKSKDKPKPKDKEEPSEEDEPGEGGQSDKDDKPEEDKSKGDGDSSDEEGEEPEDEGKGSSGRGEEADDGEDDGDQDEGQGDADDEGDDDGEGSGGSDSDGEDEGESETGDGEGESGQPSEAGEDKEPTGELSLNEGEVSASGQVGAGESLNINWEALKELGDELAETMLKEMDGAFDTREMVDYTREYDVIEPYKVNGKPNVEKIAAEVHQMAGAMQSHLQRIIVAKSQSYAIPGFRSGKLNGPSLHRLKAGDDRIFKRRHIADTNKVAVTLLIDCSGSMAGGVVHGSHTTKIKVAMISAWAFSEVLDRLKIPNEVIGFTSGRGPDHWTHDDYQKYEDGREAMSRTTGVPLNHIRSVPIHMPLFKSFEEKFGPEVKQRMAGRANSREDMRGNDDATAIRIAGDRLRLRPETRKIMFVFSDGQPAESGVDTRVLYASTKSASVNLKKHGIETLGIGIGSSEVKAFYEKWHRIDKAEELPKFVIHSLEKLLAA